MGRPSKAPICLHDLEATISFPASKWGWQTSWLSEGPPKSWSVCVLGTLSENRHYLIKLLGLKQYRVMIPVKHTGTFYSPVSSSFGKLLRKLWGDMILASAWAMLFLGGTHLQLWPYGMQEALYIFMVMGNELPAMNFMLQRPEWHIKEDLP